MGLKADIRSAYAKAREAWVFGSEALARAADSAAQGDVEGFHREMAEAGRLALISAKHTKEAWHLNPNHED